MNCVIVKNLITFVLIVERRLSSHYQKIINMKNNKFKKITNIVIYTLLISILTSCYDDVVKYPQYSLDTIEYVPDSLKNEYRVWIQESIRAASQHMSGGDYEDVDDTIRQAKWTADELFKVRVIGLRKEINDRHYDDLNLSRKDLTPYEITILDSLMGKR
jgi:hypothetical protein